MRGPRRLAWWCLVAGLGGILVAYPGGIAARGAAWPSLMLAVAMPLATLGVTLLGVGVRARRPVITMIALVHGLVAAAFVLALPAASPWVGGTWGGVPRATVLVALGAGLIPLLLLPVVYVVAFPRAQLSEADLSRVREAARRA